MKATNHVIYDNVTTIYYLNTGEKVDRHVHDFVHTTCCLAGESEVFVDGQKSFKMQPGQADISLPGGVPHEVVALKDNTILMHVFKREYLGVRSTPPSNITPDIVRPGVLMDDGTIEYPPQRNADHYFKQQTLEYNA